MNRKFPRPQLVRDNWMNLNGYWNFDFDDSFVGMDEKWYVDHKFSKKILVPFPYQSKLSGLHDTSMHERVWYDRTFTLEKPQNQRVILNFEAVDYEAHVFVNGKLVGKHVGGSTHFSFDITDHLNSGLEQKLTLMVYDPSLDPYISRGKQTWRKTPFECFYDRTTGIWQTVWIEFVHESGLKDIKITPNIDEPSVHFMVDTLDPSPKEVRLTAFYETKEVFSYTHKLLKRDQFKIDIPKDMVHLWSPETPHLYDLKIEILKNGQVIDETTSYFGLRKVHIEGKQIYLNNKPYYLRLILDQGYYPTGLMSYPSEDDLLNDIKLAKQMGFNGARKHAKIEARRFAHYADKEGFLLSLEMPSQYAYKANTQFGEEWFDALNRDYNNPSIFMLIPFNESWGVRNIKQSVEQQNYVTGFYYLTKSLDPTRIVVTNDGWEQTVTEVCTVHSYRHGKMDDLKVQNEFYKSLTDLDTLLSPIHTNGNHPIYVGNYKYSGEPILLSEFGGVSFANQKQEGWGYTGVDNETDYVKELKRIFNAVYDSAHLNGFCYTQLTDVEQEINGLLTYDRKPKTSLDTIRKIVTNTK